MSLLRNTRLALTLVIAAVLAAVLLWLLRPDEQAPTQPSGASVDVPVVMHTSGGRLEVATITATEAFKLDAPPKKLLGIDLGQTFSHIQVKVVYRFYIDMAKEWPIRLNGMTAVVEAGEIKPSLPVAIDTTTMEKQTRSGWARFDKHQNLDRLEQLLSPELEKRAYGYKKLALDSARQSVADFVRTWLIKEQRWQQGLPTTVQVLFPGETPAADNTVKASPSRQPPAQP